LIKSNPKLFLEMMEPSIDKKINRNKEQQYVEGSGEKRQSQSSQNATNQNAKKADAVQAYLNAHPELTSEQRKPYEAKIKEFRGSSSSGVTGISFEDTQRLLQQLQLFQETIGGDWRSVMSQWQNLQNCWQDRQYDRFEPFFEQLCRTYEQCEQQCQEYTQFLEERIRGSEDAATTLNM
jgi:hypothetical protein